MASTMTLDELYAEIKALKAENGDLRSQLRLMRQQPNDMTPSPESLPHKETTAVVRKSREHA